MCEREEDLPIDDKLVSSIVEAMLTIPLPFSQVCVPGLEKYSQLELERLFQRVLTNPPESVEVREPVRKPLWTDEEDFFLLTFRNSKDSSLTQFMREYGSCFKACRTITDIENRMEELGRMSSEQIDEILLRLARRTVLEERFYQSRHSNGPGRAQCNCTLTEFPDVEPSDEAEREIEQLQTMLPFLVDEVFRPNDLALFMGTNVRFSMRQRFVVIGRAASDTSVDIDLGFLSEHICSHVSRLQATFQLLPDGNFYVENIGNSVFRVCGKVIFPKQFCKVPPGAILDFADNILIFIPNKKLIDRIMKELNEHMRHVQARLAAEGGHDRP